MIFPGLVISFKWKVLKDPTCTNTNPMYSNHSIFFMYPQYMDTIFSKPFSAQKILIKNFRIMFIDTKSVTIQELQLGGGRSRPITYQVLSVIVFFFRNSIILKTDARMGHKHVLKKNKILIRKLGGSIYYVYRSRS